MARGDNLYASGIVLVTPLEMEVLEEADSGRVRVTVLDARTKDPVPKVQVKVIGSAEQGFHSGETDLRGVFVAEGVQGEVTAVARQEARYAFHRGTTYVGQPPAQEEAAKQAAPAATPKAPAEEKSLESNVKALNSLNRAQQIDRLQQRFQQGGQDAKGEAGAAVGGFR